MERHQIRKGFRFEWNRHGPTLRVWLDDDHYRWELFRIAERRGVRYLGAASIGVSGYRFEASRSAAYGIVEELHLHFCPPVDTGL